MVLEKYFNSIYFQKFIDSFENPCLIINPEGVVIYVNEALEKLVIDDIRIKHPETNGKINGLTYIDLTLSGECGELILPERINRFKECITKKSKTKFIDINRNNVFEGVFTPVCDDNDVIQFIHTSLSIITEQKELEYKRNILFFSDKEMLFLKEMVNYVSIRDIFKNKHNFRDFYVLSISEETKRKIERSLKSDSGFFNRSEYVNRIDVKLIRNNIILNEFLLSLKLFD